MTTDHFRRALVLRCVLPAWVAVVPFSAYAGPQTPPVCFDAGQPPYSDIDIQLTKTLISTRGLVSGVFRVSNHAADKAIKIQGILYKSEFWVDRPFSALEFRDLNGNWDTYFLLRFDSWEKNGFTIVKPGSSVLLHRDLFPRQEMSDASADMRLALPLIIGAQTVCLNSTQFKMSDGEILGVEQQRVRR